jgi:predicted NAD-dependent protein-ADP-ribosyltransferase YbiA (DUF1768 family)
MIVAVSPILNTTKMDIDTLTDLASSMTISKTTAPMNVIFEYGGRFNEFAIAPFSAEIPAFNDDCPMKAEFKSVAQYVHIAKALLFGEIQIAEQIFEVTDPSTIWELSSRIAVDAELWDAWRYDMYLDANRAKIEADSTLYFELLETLGRDIVEPRDPSNMNGITLLHLRKDLFGK